MKPQFDDPALKKALCAALGAEMAPEYLRERIGGLMAAHSSPLPMWRRRPARVFALAAAILIVGMGVGTWLMLQSREQPVPDWFADAMIATHDQCKVLSDHHLLARTSDTDLVGLRKTMREILGHPALVAMLGDGWKFKGAGICQVGKVPAAHLLFARNDETVSIFSVSEKLLYANAPADGNTYSQIRNDHELAGFVFGGAIHCLVGDSKSRKLTLGEVIQLREALRTSPAGLGPQVRPLRVAH